MVLGKKNIAPESTSKEAESSKGNGSSEDIRDKATKERGEAFMWGTKGNALVESSMYAEAIKCYDKALEINPMSMEAWNNKGMALARMGRLAEAIECYDKALQLNPGDSEVMYNKGISLALLGRSSEAIECYDKLLKISPNDADAWCSKGDVLFESSRYEEALAAYDKSIAIDPKDETTWNNKGMTLVKLNRFTEAIEAYDIALEINPKVEKIWSNKGLAIAKMGENKEKIDLQKLAASMPRDDKSIPHTGKQQSVEKAALTPQVQVDDVKTPPVIEPPLSGQTETVAQPDLFAETRQVEQLSRETAKQEQVLEPQPKPELVPSAEKSGFISGDKAVNIEKPQPVEDLKNPPVIEPPLSGQTATVAQPDLFAETRQVEQLNRETAKQKQIFEPESRPEPEPSVEKSDSITGDKAALTSEVPVGNVKTPPVAQSDLPAETKPVEQLIVETARQEQAVEPGSSIRKEESIAIDKTADDKAYFGPPMPSGEVKIAPVMETILSRQVDFEYDTPEPKHEEPVKNAEAGTPVTSDEPASAPAVETPTLVQEDAKPAGEELVLTSLLEKSVSDVPGNIKKSQEYLVMGNNLYSVGKYEGAVEFFGKSLQIDPGNSTGWNNIGLALGKTGKLDEAIICYNKALEITPADYVVLNNKGSALYKKGKVAEAAECYKSALKLNPDSKTAIRGVEVCMKLINKSRKTKSKE